MIVHIDCNAFFASCEIATREGVENRPVVVANGNEAGGGVILALNNKAKKIGLHRGHPLFQVKDLLEKYQVAVFPADHVKYRQISAHIMQTVQQQGIVQDFLPYSVDEFFGSLPLDKPEEVRAYVAKVKQAIEENTKIPVSCGCSLTYTLAKVATYYAKHYAGYKGICVLTADKLDKALSMLPVEEVWGIGRTYRKKMQALQIVTAKDLVNKEESLVKKALNTRGWQTWQELKGISCVKISTHEQQQSIMQSRTFAYMIEDKEELQKHISDYASACCVRLRKQHSVCKTVTVFIATNRHRTDLPQYGNSASVKLPVATSDTPTIVKAALQVFEQLYRPFYQYKRAGVILNDINDDSSIQLDLFANQDIVKQRKLMKIADTINEKFGAETLHWAIQDSPKEPSKGDDSAKG